MTDGEVVAVAGSPPLRLPDELLEKSGFLLVRLAMGFKAQALAALEAEGSSQYHYGVLAVVGEQERAPKAQTMIAAALGIDPSQLVGILDALEKKRLITRRRDPEDRRRQVVSLTAKGAAHLVRLRNAIDRMEDAVFAPLSAADRQAFHALLLRLASFHDAHCPGDPPA